MRPSRRPRRSSSGRKASWTGSRRSSSATRPRWRRGRTPGPGSHLREFGPGYLWFRHDGKEYVVRDGEKLKEINDLADRQSELGAEQGRLGRVQGDLGRQQGQLGRQQGEMGREQARKALHDAWR